MKRKKRIFIIISSFISLCAVLFVASHGVEGRREIISLWPEIEPFKTGYLKVSGIHEIYYELSGNPKGKPVFFLHGGPGGSSSPYMRRFCNPEKFLIVLYDQRGSGRSRPYGEIKDNTTQFLVDDIERLRKHLKLGKVILFGGSWGTTLGLSYAEAYPENVSGMILRGVFTATKEEIDHFYHGGVARFFPEIYGALLDSLPEPSKRPLHEYLFRLIHDGSQAEKDKYSKAWARYEIKISGLVVPDKVVEDFIRDYNPYAFGLLENFYMANGCFLKENQLWNNIKKISNIPTIIVNGRYDVICPPKAAYRLHKSLPKSKIFIAEAAGHWMGEKPIQRALLKAMKDFE
ncbi:MAG: prolyl aminopeptidase [Candidatus Aminicenantaceae bacterium]